MKNIKLWEIPLIIFVVLSLWFISVTNVHADILADGSNIFTNDSKTVLISSVAASPTQILSADSFITRTYIVNNTTFSVFLGTTSASVSTTTSPSIPGCASNAPCPVWSPDGPVVPYWGPMWAVLAGTSPTVNTISVIREK